MSRTARRFAASVLLQLAAVCMTSASALATDDYTLPFYDPSVTLSYGVDRDAVPALQQRAGDFPLAAVVVGGQDEEALSRTDEECGH